MVGGAGGGYAPGATDGGASEASASVEDVGEEEEVSWQMALAALEEDELLAKERLELDLETQERAHTYPVHVESEHVSEDIHHDPTVRGLLSTMSQCPSKGIKQTTTTLILTLEVVDGRAGAAVAFTPPNSLLPQTQHRGSRPCTEATRAV
eukprot:SAG11_NODE_474_length_9142_cov_6.507907_4_plen_151_part_00